MQSAVVQLLRWAGRGEVRRALLGSAGQGLSANDVTLLRAIAADGPVRASDLADAQGVDKSTISVQVRRLEQRGLVTRRADPADRRAVLLSATTAGRRVRRAMNAAGARLYDEVLCDWPDDEREALAWLLSRFVAELGRWPAPARSTVPPAR